MKELTLKQRKFVDEYLKDFNATQAAIRAGYPEKSAHSVGYENLQRPVIKSLIEEFQKRSLEGSFISQAAILQELSRYAFRDRSGNYPEMSARVSIQALHLLGKHVGLFWERPPDQKKAEYERVFEEAMKEIEAEKIRGQS